MFASPLVTASAQQPPPDATKTAAPAAAPADAVPAAETAPAAETRTPPAAETPAAEAPSESASPQESAADNAAADNATSNADSPPAAAESTKAVDGADVPKSAAPNSKAAGTKPAPAADTVSRPLIYGLIIVGLFVLPVVIGNLIASWLRMPDYGWKISLVLGTLAASIVVILLGQLKFGPDLAGGITLIYEIEAAPQASAPNGAVPPDQPKADLQEAIAILKRRIDPTGTREVTIREYGPAIEVIIPNTGPDALQYVKRRITEMGQLEFRITADPSQPSSQEKEIIRLAQELPPAQTDVSVGGRVVAQWVPYSVDEFGPVDKEDARQIVKRMAGDTPEALVLVDPAAISVTGDYLRSVSKGVDERGGPAVNFTFDTQGARRFQQLTSNNRPNAATGARRYLGIVLDKRLLSAPSIETTIYASGQISGRNMSEQEVDNVVSILREGKLPIQLSKEPISEEIISPTLGKVTIDKGKQAIFWSFIATIVFMLVYYRFAGVVACLALLFNLLLVVALMILIQASLTLPGLAGLVLTIGMSVDANVLIFERMREELRGGAAFRMVIRNGFDRAMSAIVDSNVTTIISGLALYFFATDQVKGFAVTLVLGILTSMYTAIFCSRLIFDICERQGWVKTIHMLRLMTTTNLDFLRWRFVAIGGSTLLILIGIAAMYGRGQQLLDIDFTGGSSVSFALEEADKMSIDQVRRDLVSTELGTKNLLVVERGSTQTRYTIDTSEQSVDRVKEVVQEAFAGKLQMFAVELGAPKPFDDKGFTGTEVPITINQGKAYEVDEGVSHDALVDMVQAAIKAEGVTDVTVTVESPDYRAGSAARLKQWNVRLGGANEQTAQRVFANLKSTLEHTPMFPLANKIGGRVSAKMQVTALEAIFFSLVGTTVYLWLRFQKAVYGLAAAAALVHDVLVTLGMIALSAYIVAAVPQLASALQIDSFQINLTIVAAVLTIMGFSLNDTIVIFDRVREVRGKRPYVTAEIVNTSINQTLSRTILTSLTVFIVVVILYFFGGDGIHGFAYAFMIGVVTGTYSTIYIATPMLLWLSGASADASAAPPK
jgi:SecD/SecF fusion protein